MSEVWIACVDRKLRFAQSIHTQTKMPLSLSMMCVAGWIPGPCWQHLLRYWSCLQRLQCGWVWSTGANFLLLMWQLDALARGTFEITFFYADEREERVCKIRWSNDYFKWSSVLPWKIGKEFKCAFRARVHSGETWDWQALQDLTKLWSLI